MNRRDFIKRTAIGTMATGMASTTVLANTDRAAAYARPKRLVPQRIREGITIGLIAPGSAPTEEKLNRAITNLIALGYRVNQGGNLRAKNGYLAGTDAERIEDIHWAFSDPEVDAIWCVRGGYGCSRLLPDLDYKLIKKNPKPLIGYSDITALHLAIGQKTGLVTFHGPVAVSEFPASTLTHFKRVLIDPTVRYEINMPGINDPVAGPEYRASILKPGVASGRLTGGNLSLLASLVGTEFSPKFKNRIVFIEEVGEQPYRIDRMLTQLLQGTDLKKASGVVLGVFEDCFPTGKEASLELMETLMDRLGGLGIPVAYGFPIGHIAEQATIPYGVMASLNTEKRSLTLEEWAVR